MEGAIFMWEIWVAAAFEKEKCLSTAFVSGESGIPGLSGNPGWWRPLGAEYIGLRHKYSRFLNKENLPPPGLHLLIR